MSENDRKLTPRQKRAIAALLSSKSVRDAALVAEVSERQLYRWFERPDFQAALLEAESAAIDAETRRLVGLSEVAVSALEKLLTNPGTTNLVRLRAIQARSDIMLRMLEMRALEQRLTALESAIYGGQSTREES